MHSNNCKNKASNSNQAQKLFHSIGPGVIGEDLKDPNSIQKHWKAAAQITSMHPILILWLQSGAEGSPSKKVMVSNYTAARPVRSPSVPCTLVLCVGGSWNETTESEKKIFDQFHLRLQTTTQLVFSLNPPRTSRNSTRRDPDFECVLCSVFCVSLSKKVIVMNWSWSERIV